MGRANNKKIKVNKTITAYDRAQILSDINTAADEGRLLFYDKKRSLQQAGVPGANYPGAILEKDFGNNIANFWNNVKWENKNKTPAPPRQYQNGTAEAESRPVRVPTDVSEYSISEADPIVNKKFSISPSGNTETAKQHFGTTRDWAETGYLLTDGTQLDFSGRHWGGDGGDKNRCV